MTSGSTVISAITANARVTVVLGATAADGGMTKSVTRIDSATTSLKFMKHLHHQKDVWGIEKDFFMAAATDSASNMNTFGRTIKGWIVLTMSFS